MIRIMASIVAILMTTLLFSSCTQIHPRGYIYDHVTLPFTTNFSKTPFCSNKCSGDIRHVHIRYVDFKWHSNAIGDIAKEHGINTVYFADIEKFKILGIWNQYTVHIYGK